jgi:peptidoglycan biosynthesis protein MviN/MurJ (putative lipid II flippase)
VTVGDKTRAADQPGSPNGEPDLALSSPEGAVGDSMSVAVWTIVSRCTGVLRGIVIAAVLGATYFANTYQFTNILPNLVFYGLLAGSLFTSILVPALVPHVDSGDSRAQARTAGGLLGVAMIGMLAIVPVAAVGAPWLLRLGAMDATDAAAAHGQQSIGAILVLLLLPQVVLYAVVCTASAVMNAHRRFALAAAAPALENIGTMAVLAVVAVLYTRAAREHLIPLSLVLLLGAGTTGAVLLHASVQWWGARRVGVTIRPRAGWREPQVRTVIRGARPAAAQAGLEALQFVALLVVADRVPGGVVAFQLAMNFFFLPVALGASPVALSLVPRLSRMTAPDQACLFRDTFSQGLAFAAFLVIPAATGYAILSGPLAGAIGFGGFGTSSALHLISASVIGLAPGIIGQTLFLVTTFACYSRGDTVHPFRGMVIQAVVCAAGIAVASRMHGLTLLTALGLSLSAGTVCGSLYLVRQLLRGLPGGGGFALRPLLRTLACTLVMIGPAWDTATFLDHHVGSRAGHAVAMIAATVVGAGVYFTAQAIMSAPEMQWIAGAVLRRRRGLQPRGGAPADSPGAATAPHPMRWEGWLLVADSVVWPLLRRLRRDLVLLLGCAAVGALLATKLKYGLIMMVLLGLIGLIVARPAFAGYLLVFLTPLIVGVNAGAFIPLVRPNEALILLFALIIAVRWLVLARTGDHTWPRFDRIDLSMIALGVTSSVLPLLMMVGRDRPIDGTDLLYSIVLWKLIAEYVIVRSVITTREQAMRCLWLSMWSAAIVCWIGILQDLNLLGVQHLLATYYAPLDQTSAVSIGRGSSLLALPAAVADLAILNLAIAIGMLVRGYRRRPLLFGLAVTYALGVVAAAEFSTIIGLVVAVIVVVILTKSGRILLYAVPVALLGGVLLWPVIEIRLGGFANGSTLPYSWVVRLQNLQSYFWPVLFSDWNWILGVRPTARVAVATQEYGYVWIESGYTWLLWGGGIPLLGSYLAFVWSIVRKGSSYARRADAAGIVGLAMATAIMSQAVMMIFDPHLTFRGSGDALFLILALLRKLPGRQQRPSPDPVVTTAADPAPRRQEVLV